MSACPFWLVLAAVISVCLCMALLASRGMLGPHLPSHLRQASHAGAALTASCKGHYVPTGEGEDSAAWAGWDDVDTVQTTQSAKKKQDTDDWGKW